MTIINIAAPLLAFQMHNSLKVCKKAMNEHVDPSLAVIDMFDLYNRHTDGLAAVTPKIIDNTLSLAMHRKATAGRADRIIWRTGSPFVTAATIHKHDFIPGNGDESKKMAAGFACCVIVRIAERQPQAFDSHHLTRLLRLTGFVDSNVIADNYEMPIHSALISLATHNPAIFDESHIAKIGKRHRDMFNEGARDNQRLNRAFSYKAALAALLLQDEPLTPELPSANVLPFKRPEPR